MEKQHAARLEILHLIVDSNFCTIRVKPRRESCHKLNSTQLTLYLLENRINGILSTFNTIRSLH